MAVVVPASDLKNTPKAAEVTAVAAIVTATAAGPSKDSAQQRQIAVNAELVDALMASGKLSPLTILSTCTYGT